MKKRLRGFEIAKGWEDKNINLPVRKTAHSAGETFPHPVYCGRIHTGRSLQHSI